MAVPKKRTGHSAQGKRRSNWKATKPTLTTCPNCGQAVLAHTVCTACETYKGKPVALKDQQAEEVKETKKTTAKKSTKKATTAEAEVKETQKTTAKKSTKKEVKAEEVTETTEKAEAEEKTEE